MTFSAFVEVVLVSFAALAIAAVLLASPSPAAILRLPIAVEGPCPGFWHPYIDECRKWPA